MILQRIFKTAITPPENPPSVELRILSNTRRRIIIEALHEHDELDLTELVGIVAEREAGKPITEVTAKTHNRVYTSLYQTHVPKLAATGTIDYIADKKLLRANDRLRGLFEAYCRFAGHIEDPIEPPVEAE